MLVDSTAPWEVRPPVSAPRPATTVRVVGVFATPRSPREGRQLGRAVQAEHGPATFDLHTEHGSCWIHLRPVAPGADAAARAGAGRERLPVLTVTTTVAGGADLPVRALAALGRELDRRAAATGDGSASRPLSTRWRRLERGLAAVARVATPLLFAALAFDAAYLLMRAVMGDFVR